MDFASSYDVEVSSQQKWILYKTYLQDVRYNSIPIHLYCKEGRIYMHKSMNIEAYVEFCKNVLEEDYNLLKDLFDKYIIMCKNQHVILCLLFHECDKIFDLYEENSLIGHFTRENIFHFNFKSDIKYLISI